MNGQTNVQTKWYHKQWGIVLLLIFFFPAGAWLMWRNTNWNSVLKKIITGVMGVWFLFWVLVWSIVFFGDDPVKIDKIAIAQSEITLDVGEEREISHSIEPENADNITVNCFTENKDIVAFENSIAKGVTEGDTYIYLTNSDKTITSNKVKVTVIDRVAQAKKEAEEQEKAKAIQDSADHLSAKIEAIGEPKLENKNDIERIRTELNNAAPEVQDLVKNIDKLTQAETTLSDLEKAEQERIEAEKSEKEAVSKANSAAANTEVPKQASSQPSENVNTNPEPSQPTPPPATASMVWIDDSAAKYHRKNGCGMDNAYQVTLEEAKAKGKTPCGRCY